MRRRSALGAATLIITLVGCCSGRAANVSYLGMMARLKAADATGRVRVVRIGYSVKGRAIAMAAIGRCDAPVRVLVLCRQHGDEPVSTEAALQVIGRFARGDRRIGAGLENTQLLIVPMVNPDGAERFTRENAKGVDLNRDWTRRSQPETRAVANLYTRMAPQVVLDEHEWTASDSCGYDALETGQSAGRVARQIQIAAVTTGTERGVPLLAYRFSAYIDPSLAHPYFQSRGSASFLLETTPNVPIGRRVLLYDLMMVRVGKAAELYARRAPAPQMVSRFPTAFASRPSMPRAPRSPWAALSFTVFGVIALVFSALNGRPGVAQPGTVIWPGARRIPLGQVSDLAARLQRRHAPTG